MTICARSVLALAAILAVGARCATPARYALAADLPSAGSGLLGEHQTGTAAAGTAKAEVTEPAYNFGTALSGPPINHVFMIKNVGTGPLEIKNVTSSCGCTAAKPSKNILAPGEVSTIAASVDTHFEQGHSLSVVTLTTNDPANPSLQLKLEGVIKPQVAAQPMDVDFGSVHHGSAAARDVVVSDTVGAAGFALKSVKNDSPYIKVTEAARTDGKPGALLHVAVSPSMPPGPISDTLRIETSLAPLSSRSCRRGDGRPGGQAEPGLVRHSAASPGRGPNRAAHQPGQLARLTCLASTAPATAYSRGSPR